MEPEKQDQQTGIVTSDNGKSEENTTTLKSSIQNFQIEGKDEWGNTIIDIYSKRDEYIIYEIRTNRLSNSIRVAWKGKTDESDKILKERFLKISDEFGKLKGLLYKVVNQDTSAVKERIAQIISIALDGQDACSEALFKDLIKEIEDEYQMQIQHRICHLLVSLVFFIATAIACCIIYLKQIWEPTSLMYELLLVCSMGILGGFLSTAGKLKKWCFNNTFPIGFLCVTP